MEKQTFEVIIKNSDIQWDGVVNAVSVNGAKSSCSRRAESKKTYIKIMDSDFNMVVERVGGVWLLAETGDVVEPVDAFEIEPEVLELEPETLKLVVKKPRFEIKGFEKTDISLRIMTDFPKASNPYNILNIPALGCSHFFTVTDYTCAEYVDLMVKELNPEYVLKLRGWLRNNRYKSSKADDDKVTSLAITKKTADALNAYPFDGSRNALIRLALAALIREDESKAGGV